MVLKAFLPSPGAWTRFAVGRWLFLGCLLSLVSLPLPSLAQIMGRPLPANAKLGQMSPPQGGMVMISGNTYRLSPGAQIRNSNNLIVVPDSLADLPSGVMIRYVLDGNGQVFRIWILTPAEAAERWSTD